MELKNEINEINKNCTINLGYEEDVKNFWENRHITGSIMPIIFGFFINDKIQLYNTLIQLTSYKTSIKIKNKKLDNINEVFTKWGKIHQDCAEFIFDIFFNKYLYSIPSLKSNPSNEIILKRLIDFSEGTYNNKQKLRLKKILSLPPISATPDLIIFNKEKNITEFVGEIKCKVPYRIENNEFQYIANKYAHTEVPLYYKPQMCLEMLCTGIKKILFISWTPRETKIYKGEYSAKFCYELIDNIIIFFENYIFPINYTLDETKIEELANNFIEQEKKYKNNEDLKKYKLFKDETLKNEMLFELFTVIDNKKDISEKNLIFFNFKLNPFL